MRKGGDGEITIIFSLLIYILYIHMYIYTDYQYIKFCDHAKIWIQDLSSEYINDFWLKNNEFVCVRVSVYLEIFKILLILYWDQVSITNMLIVISWPEVIHPLVGILFLKVFEFNYLLNHLSYYAETFYI